MLLGSYRMLLGYCPLHPLLNSNTSWSCSYSCRPHSHSFLLKIFSLEDACDIDEEVQFHIDAVLSTNGFSGSEVSWYRTYTMVQHPVVKVEDIEQYWRH